MGSARTWTFPRNIDFGAVPNYLRMMEERGGDEILIFDLKATEVIHSSFIGFLIHAKEELSLGGGRLILRISPSLSKTLRRMRLIDYFAPLADADRPIPDRVPALN